MFAFDPKKFCETAMGDIVDQNGNLQGTGPYPYACPINKNPNEDGGDPEADYPNFFQLPVLMLMLITLLNDGTLISVGYDRVKPSPRPGATPPPAAAGCSLASSPATVPAAAPKAAASRWWPLRCAVHPCLPHPLAPALRAHPCLLLSPGPLPPPQRSGTCACCSWCPPCWASSPWAPPCCWSAWCWTPPTRAPSSRSGACPCR